MRRLSRDALLPPLLVLLALAPYAARAYSSGVDFCTDTPGHGTVAGPGGGYSFALTQAGAAVAAYAPGVTYTISLSGASPFRGFAAGCWAGTAVASVFDPMAGVFGAGSGSRLQGGCAGLTQASPPVAPPTTITGTWTAPPAGTGAVTFWAVVVATMNGNHHTVALTVPELVASPTATPSPSLSPAATPTRSATPTPSSSHSPTPSATPSSSPTTSMSPTPSVTPTASLTLGASASLTSSRSLSPTPSASASISAPSATPQASPAAQSQSATPPATPSLSASASAASASPSAAPGTVVVAGALALSGVDASAVSGAAVRAALEEAIAAAAAAAAGIPAADAGSVSARVLAVADAASGASVYRALQAAGAGARLDYGVALPATLASFAGAVASAVAAGGGGGATAFAAAVVAKARANAAAAGLPAATLAQAAATALSPAVVPAALPFSVSLSPSLTMAWQLDAAANRLRVRITSSSGGWASVAFSAGSKMIPADAVIIEPAAASAVTQAALTSYAMSGVQRVPAASGTLDALATSFASSASGGGWTAEFSRPLVNAATGVYAGARSLSASGSIGLIAAWGGSGLMSQHSPANAVAFSVNLATGSAVADSARGALLVAHGVLMAVAFGRGHAGGLKAHMQINAAAWLLFVAGAACGIALVPAGLPHFATTHSKAALAVLVLALPQPLLGIYGPSPAHRAMGYAASVIAAAAIFLGLSLAGARPAWASAFAALLAAWVVAFSVLEARQRGAWPRRENPLASPASTSASSEAGAAAAAAAAEPIFIAPPAMKRRAVEGGDDVAPTIRVEVAPARARALGAL